MALNLGFFAGTDIAAAEQIVEDGGWKVLNTSTSPFGPVIKALPSQDWTAMLQSKFVQVAERAPSRVSLNDLSRVTVGESTDTLTSSNYLGDCPARMFGSL